MLKEDLLCGTQERNDINNEDQINIKKDDEFIANNVEKVSKLKKEMLNELSNLRHTEIKKKEPLRKIQNNKKNKFG